MAPPLMPHVGGAPNDEGPSDAQEIDRQRQSSGGLPDESAEDPVKDGPVPYKNLRGGR